MRHGVIRVDADHLKFGIQVFQTLVRIAHDAAFARHREHFSVVHSVAKGDTLFQAVPHRLSDRFQRMTFDTPPAITSRQVSVEKLTFTQSPQRALIACSSGNNFS